MADPVRDALEKAIKYFEPIAAQVNCAICPTDNKLREAVDGLKAVLATPPPAADAELVAALEKMRPALEAATESWTSKVDGDSIFIWKRCSNIPGRDVGISLRMITDLLAALTKHSAPEAGEQDNG